jgi:hypothetical protein
MVKVLFKVMLLELIVRKVSIVVIIIRLCYINSEFYVS